MQDRGVGLLGIASVAGNLRCGDYPSHLDLFRRPVKHHVLVALVALVVLCRWTGIVHLLRQESVPFCELWLVTYRSGSAQDANQTGLLCHFDKLADPSRGRPLFSAFCNSTGLVQLAKEFEFFTLYGRCDKLDGLSTREPRPLELAVTSYCPSCWPDGCLIGPREATKHSGLAFDASST